MWLVSSVTTDGKLVGDDSEVSELIFERIEKSWKQKK